VFVAIVAIWAVYLLQHWVRRREHLATARSVDRYSEAMRVLDRRTPGTTRTSAAVSGGTSTPQAVLSRPVVTMSGSAPGTGQAPATVGLTPLGAGVAKVAGLNGRRLAGMARGIIFLGALAGAPILTVLALLSRAPWTLLVLDLMVLGGSVVVLRRAAVARRRRAAAGRAAGRHPAAGGTGRRPAAQRFADPRTAGRVGASRVAPVGRVDVAGQSRMADIDEATQPIPVEDLPVASGADARGVRTADLAAAEGTWSPVPVPPPTYTLKERVERPAPAPLAIPGTEVVEPAVHELAEAVRRAANG
jgi:hypothetical protein